MRVLASVRLRLQRGLSLSSLGPNEARIIYDLLAASGALAAAWCFGAWAVGAAGDPWLLAMPGALVAANALGGVYTRFRAARGSAKAGLVLGACAVVALAFGLAGSERAVVVLWALLAAPPLVLPRLLLDLPFSPNRYLARVAVRQRGPVLVVDGTVDEIPAVGPVEVTLDVERKPRSVRLAFEEGEVEARFRGGRKGGTLHVRVPRVGIHAAVVVER